MMIAAHFLVAVQTMMAREKDTFSHAIITFDQIKGGTARNIICDEVNLVGTLRTLNKEDKNLSKKRIFEICTYIGKSFNSE